MAFRRLQILAVNGDDAVQRQINAAMQGDHNWSLTTASAASSAELVAQVRERAPDVMLLDITDRRIDPLRLALELEAARLVSFPMVVLADSDPVASAAVFATGLYDFLDARQLDPLLLRHVVYNSLERARLLRDLRDTEDHFRAVANTVPVHVWECDTTMACTFVNEAMLAFTGRTLEEELGFGWEQGIHPDDRKRCRQQFAEAFAARQPFRLEFRLRCHDGSYRCLLDQGRPRYDANGDFLGFVGTSTDIDAHVQMERALEESDAEMRRHLALLQAVYTTAPVGLAFTDVEHRYVSVNDRLAALTGRTVEELLGEKVNEVVPAPVGQNALAMRQTVLQTGQPLLDVELHGVSASEPDVPRTWLGSYFPVYDEAGQPLGVNAVVVEITGRKRAEERLEAEVRARTAQSRKLATDLTLAEQRERRRIARVLHDDIQQKLYALQVQIYILSQQPALQAKDSSRLRMDVIGRLIDELIEDNSTLSVELSPPTISHEGLLDAIGWLRQYIALQHGLQIHLETAGDLTVPDPDLREVIFQMVRELLLNVAQHAGVDEAYLRLRRVGERLVVRVADEGSGFDPALLDSGEDAAFGLRTLRERVDIFGGAVEVDSQPGQGTRITLVMPTAL